MFQDATYDDTDTTFFTDLHRDSEVKAVVQANAAIAKHSRTTSDTNVKPSGRVKRAKTGEEKENKPLSTKPLCGRATKAHKEALAAQGKAVLEDNVIIAAGRPCSDDMKSKLFMYILSPENDNTFHTFQKNPDWVYRKVKCLCLIKHLSTYLIIRLQLTCTKTRSQRALSKANGLAHFLFIKRSSLSRSSPDMAVMQISRNTSRGPDALGIR